MRRSVVLTAVFTLPLLVGNLAAEDIPAEMVAYESAPYFSEGQTTGCSIRLATMNSERLLINVSFGIFAVPDEPVVSIVKMTGNRMGADISERERLPLKAGWLETADGQRFPTDHHSTDPSSGALSLYSWRFDDYLPFISAFTSGVVTVGVSPVESSIDSVYSIDSPLPASEHQNFQKCIRNLVE